jgi:hypothetical protein
MPTTRDRLEFRGEKIKPNVSNSTYVPRYFKYNKWKKNIKIDKTKRNFHRRQVENNPVRTGWTSRRGGSVSSRICRAGRPGLGRGGPFYRDRHARAKSPLADAAAVMRAPDYKYTMRSLALRPRTMCLRNGRETVIKPTSNTGSLFFFFFFF